MKKWMGPLSAVGVSAAMLVGSLASAQAADMNKAVTGTITVLTNRTDMQANGMLNTYSKEFEKLYPGTTVKWQTFVDNNTVQAQMNGGVYPDVMLILPSVTKEELPQFFAPLDNLGLDGKVYFGNYQSYQGKTYGIASFGDTNGIVYNVAAFKKAGIKGVPRTLNEFYADCAMLKKAGIVPIALNYTDKWPLGNWSNSLPDLIAKNANYMNTMANENAPFSAKSPEGESLLIARTLVQKGFVEHDFKNTNWANSKVQLAKGKFGMMFLGNWAIPQIVADGTPSSNVGFFPFPATNSGKNIAIIGPDWFFAVNKNSKHIATAEAFVKWELLDSGFADYAGGIPTIKTQKSHVPQLAVFEKLASAVIPGVPDSDTLTKIENGAQLDITGGGAVQSFLIARNPASAFAQMNQAWASARMMVGK
ncbi:MAG: ABC transporter substrate-binding protein [Firmicutes bacterium]|nr:ABC transporter substrate-binding protein [Bacillota bacterium]